MSRRFARIRMGTPPFPRGYSGPPSDGMCLNVFLVLRAPDDPGRVLLGRVAPSPRWEEVGALDPARIASASGRWMIPASQLLLLEGPQEAARRVGKELLGMEVRSLPSPQVFSETSSRPGSTASDPHWDLHFIFVLAGPAAAPRSDLWQHLDYVRVSATPPADFARNHGDVLELIGLPPAGRTAPVTPGS